MKTFKEWVKKRIREADAQSNPLNVQAAVAAALNPQPNAALTDPNLLAAQAAAKLPNTFLASLAKTPKMVKITAMNALKPKMNQVIAPNQVTTPGLNTPSNFN